MQFRLVTYNIHKGIGGVDRLYRPERIVETLAHYQPDIVLLQEVDDGVPRSRHHRQVPQETPEPGTTRSPTANPATSAPTAATRPTISWPSTSGPA